MINIFDPKAEPVSMTINTIFGAGNKGPCNIALIPGVDNTISVTDDKNRTKRVLLLDKDATVIQRDINGESSLYSTKIGTKATVVYRYRYEHDFGPLWCKVSCVH